MKKKISANRIYSTFKGDCRAPKLGEQCEQLLAQQQKTWPELREAYRSLLAVESREVSCDGFSVRLIYNPGRAANTAADVRPEAVEKRPCFLCHLNLPADQKGILYRGSYLVLGNPRPAIHSHLTIAHIHHRPQTILEHVGTFLQITADLGDGWTTLYNGPQCGASAPDHLHFQAIPSGKMPIEGDIEKIQKFSPINAGPGASLCRAKGLGRNVVVIKSGNATKIGHAFRKYMERLGKESLSMEEPMVNVAGSISNGTWRLLIFPRRTHRPAAFYKEGDERIAVSPAIMEMAGIIVTPVKKDFEHLDCGTVESIYREVSLMSV